MNDQGGWCGLATNGAYWSHIPISSSLFPLKGVTFTVAHRTLEVMWYRR